LYYANDEDIKSAMGPYCRKYKSDACFLFFLSALGPIHLFEKKMDDAQTQILGPVISLGV
jgi:hypothetical protein